MSATRTMPEYDQQARRRLMAKVAVAPNGCWEWTAHIEDNGYGRFGYRGTMRWAHRVSYQIFVGCIPDGLDLDHLCRNRKCVNPDHLEPVTRKVNAERGVAGQVNRDRMISKTHCPQGHPYSGDNLYVVPSTGYRQCNACRLANKRAYRARIRNVTA